MATDPSRTFIRLNKAIAQAGQCSRRKADHLIKQGRVQVNGSIVQELGTKIQPDSDKIAIDNVPLLKTNTNLSIALHKPVQVVATLDDPQKRKTVLDLLSNTLRQKRPVPVGRLDYMTEGLLLMSN
jgi:23S rRNA pseudouridine2605 synthase